MVHPLRYTLLAEGTSDRALLPIITLTLRANVAATVSLDEPTIVDQQRLPLRIKQDRGAWLRSAVAEYPCDLLFVHRDADKDDDTAADAGRPKRMSEIAGWTEQATLPKGSGVTIVPVIPVRMTETWLLVDEPAIRAAASNAHGTSPLNLPLLRTLERRRDVKSVLDQALKAASGLRPGRLKKSFDLYKHRGRIAVTDLSRLRQLPAFRAFETDVAQAVARRGWAKT